MMLLHADGRDEAGLLDAFHPLALAAKANADDTPNYHQAMNSPDSDGFLQAMHDELTALEGLDPWEEVPRSEAAGKAILDSLWTFKRKRYPDGSVRKLKARWCVRGDQQIEGIDFFDTYAPVVAWTTVHLLLTLSVSLGLATKQVDYTLAFCQADLAHDEEIYVEMPKMFQRPGYVYKLKKAVYGLRQAPVTFFNRLKGALEDRAFVQSSFDPCLFISPEVLCLCYVDDCLLFARKPEQIDKVIDSLRGNPNEGKFLLKEEDTVAGFLGILLEPQDDGTIELKQTGLIDRILTVMDLEDSNPKSTPAATTPLGKDVKGAPCQEKWSYASVVGMMMYLASNSRPEIAFAVHSCARFTHCPRRSHELGLKRIARYLKGTRTRGMIIRPTDDLKMDCYVDADFAGLWGVEDPDDPTSVRSRSGHVITVGGTPVLWSSKLQSEIALSTMMAEYIALSQAMRDLLPMRNLVQEVCASFDIPRDKVTAISTVWEDNNGALKLANKELPICTPGSKFFAIKYHWFRSHVQSGEVEVVEVDTKAQAADPFTKGLCEAEFLPKRKMLVGW